MLELSKEYICVYCGSSSQLRRYLNKKKNGEYKTKFVTCPICKQNMKINTLIADMTAKEWGLWLYLNMRIYTNIHDNFHDKINFNLLFENFKYHGDLVKKQWRIGWYEGKKLFNENREKGLKTLMDINIKYKIYIPIKYEITQKKKLGDYFK